MNDTLDNRSSPPLAPPPMPVQPIGYATPMPPSEAELNNPARQMARASWMAPLVAMLFSCAVNSTPNQGRTAFIVMGLLLLIIVLGFTFGIMALLKMKRYGTRGILAPAIVGLCLNGLILAANGIFVVRAMSYRTMTAPVGGTNAPVAGAPAAAPPQKLTADEEAQSRIAVTDFPGWLGVDDRVDLGVRIVVLQWNDDAPATQRLKSAFATDFTMLSIIVNNTAGKQPVAIDPASLEFHLADYTTIKAIPPKDVLATARQDAQRYQQKWGGNLIVPAGGSVPDGFACLPPKADLTTARAVTLTLNGQPIIVQGRYFTAAEKRQFLDAMNGK